MHIADLVPDDSVLIALEPDELGLRILQVLAAWSPHTSQIDLANFVSGALQGFRSSNQRQDIGDALREAWAWLEGQGLLLQDPRYIGGGLRILSRKARRLAKEPSARRAVTGHRLPKETLLEVEQNKKEALFERLNELQMEMDRERTRFDTFAALAIETAGVVGDVVEKTHVLKILDSIAKVLWGLKTEEETRRLPAPTAPKRIEVPKRVELSLAKKSGRNRNDMDDEIPFWRAPQHPAHRALH
jgi:hypothetical protein